MPITSFGGPAGETDMWSMVQLLAPAGHANLVGLSAAIPAPPLPPDLHASAAASDIRRGETDAAAGFRRRLERRDGETRSAASSKGCGSTSWTPGLTLNPEGTIAELVILRGARQAGRVAATERAGAALDGWLRQDGADDTFFKHQFV